MVFDTGVFVELASGSRLGSLVYEALLSLVDCFTLALAERLRLTALFARREEELVREVAARPFEVEVLFLEDLA